MAIITKVSSRGRTQLKTLREAVMTDLETAYTTYEGSKATDTDKTWTVKVIGGYYDGTHHCLIVEASYPELNDAAGGTVPPDGGGE